MEEQKNKPATNSQIKEIIKLINPEAKVSSLKNKEQLI